jgi:hypothetical protein
MPTRCNRWIFIADLIVCSTCFGHLYAHHQELESIIQVAAACRIWCLVFKLCVRFAGSSPQTGHTPLNSTLYHEVPPYALAPSLLLQRPSRAQTLSSGPYSQTPSAYVLSSIRQSKCHAQTKQQSKLQLYHIRETENLMYVTITLINTLTKDILVTQPYAGEWDDITKDNDLVLPSSIPNSWLSTNLGRLLLRDISRAPIMLIMVSQHYKFIFFISHKHT